MERTRDRRRKKPRRKGAIEDPGDVDRLEKLLRELLA